jgi:hypothetical protein
MIKVLMAATCLMMSMAVNAATVTVDGADYDVSTVTGTYTDLSTTLQAQIWWDNQSLADTFAMQLGAQLGTPNPQILGYFSGPLFAYGTFGTELAEATSYSVDFDDALLSFPGQNWEQTWATAVSVSQVPIPAAGWLFMSAVLGLVGKKRFSRKA